MSNRLMHKLPNVSVGNEMDETVIIFDHQSRLGGQSMIRRRNGPRQIFRNFHRKGLERRSMQKLLNLLSHRENFNQETLISQEDEARGGFDFR